MQTIWLKSLLATSLAAAMLLGAVPGAIAQDKEKEKEKTEEKKKAAGGPFTGHAVTVDKAAKTVKLSGKTGRVIQITATTKITKDGKPATLDDLKEGDEVSGGFKTSADGKLEATSLTIGPKVGGKGKDKKDEKKDEKK